MLHEVTYGVWPRPSGLPSNLPRALVGAGVQPFFGAQVRCPYDGWSVPGPDMGKRGGLFSIFEDGGGATS